MKGVSLALHSGKNVADNDWRVFVIFLIYKLHEQGNSDLYHFIEALGHENIQIKKFRKTYEMKKIWCYICKLYIGFGVDL